jgi:hypothetical protein
MQLPVMQLPVAPAQTITSGDVTIHHTIHHKYEVDGASILLMAVSLYPKKPATCHKSMTNFIT